MPNMSYCRFRNTLIDLKDCAGNMTGTTDEDGEEISDEELWARNALIRLCREIAEETAEG